MAQLDHPADCAGWVGFLPALSRTPAFDARVLCSVLGGGVGVWLRVRTTYERDYFAAMTPVAQVLYWPPRVHVRVEDEPDEFDAEFTPFSEVRAGGVGRLGTRLRVGVTGSDDSTIVVATARTAVAFPVPEVPKNARLLRVNAMFTIMAVMSFTWVMAAATPATWAAASPSRTPDPPGSEPADDSRTPRP